MPMSSNLPNAAVAASLPRDLKSKVFDIGWFVITGFQELGGVRAQMEPSFGADSTVNSV
jgi:hypothetical protein